MTQFLSKYKSYNRDRFKTTFEMVRDEHITFGEWKDREKGRNDKSLFLSR